MKKIYTILLLISFQILIAQELDQEKLKFNPKINFKLSVNLKSNLLQKLMKLKIIVVI